MRVLVACEYSGTVRDAFKKMGHDALSCDLLPTDTPGEHYQGDVFDIIDDGWDLMIAHPPCTYLSNSGVGHLYSQPERWKDMIKGALFFRKLLSASIEMVAVENPIMHGYAKEIIGKNQSQIIHPWQHGHAESKATCLWLKGLNNISESDNVKGAMMMRPKRERQRLHYLSPGKDRWKLRSKTFSGIANAMANQWGGGENGI